MSIPEEAAGFAHNVRNGHITGKEGIERLAILLERLCNSAIMEVETMRSDRARERMTYWVTIPLEDLADAAAYLAGLRQPLSPAGSQ